MIEEIVKSLKEIAEIEETYQAAYKLVLKIEDDLTVSHSGRSTVPKKFYRDKQTMDLLEDLGQVVIAILSAQLVINQRVVINQKVKGDDNLLTPWSQFVSYAMEQTLCGGTKRFSGVYYL